MEYERRLVDTAAWRTDSIPVEHLGVDQGCRTFTENGDGSAAFVVDSILGSDFVQVERIRGSAAS
jgi:hypothetical protein